MARNGRLQVATIASCGLPAAHPSRVTYSLFESLSSVDNPGADAGDRSRALQETTSLTFLELAGILVSPTLKPRAIAAAGQDIFAVVFTLQGAP